MDDFQELTLAEAGDPFVAGLLGFDDAIGWTDIECRAGLDETVARLKIAALQAELLAYEVETLTRWYALGS